MKLKKKVLLLWWARLVFVTSTAILFLGLSSVTQWQVYVTLLVLCLGFSVIFTLRHKVCRVISTQSVILIKTGVFVKKEQTIIRSGICAVKLVSTPVSRAIGLVSPVIYCEGAIFFIPPLTKNQILHLELRSENFET